MANNIIKQAILLGMGSIYYSKEKMEEVFKDITDNQKLNPEEGKQMIKDIVERAQEYKTEQEKQLGKVLSKLVKDLGIATKDDIHNLRKELTPKPKSVITPKKKSTKTSK